MEGPPFTPDHLRQSRPEQNREAGMELQMEHSDWVDIACSNLATPVFCVLLVHMYLLLAENIT